MHIYIYRTVTAYTRRRRRATRVHRTNHFVASPPIEHRPIVVLQPPTRPVGRSLAAISTATVPSVCETSFTARAPSPCACCTGRNAFPSRGPENEDGKRFLSARRERERDTPSLLLRRVDGEEQERTSFLPTTFAQEYSVAE